VEEKGNKGKSEKVAKADKPGPKGNAYGLDKEFQNNMPEDIKAKVKALKALAAEKRKAYKSLKELDPAAAKAKKEEFKKAAKAKRAEILGKLTPEKKAKVEKILEEVEKESQGKGEQMRNRQRAIEVLKEKLKDNPDAKGIQNALDHVQNKKEKSKGKTE
jgi:hypothetical protein